MERVRLHNDLPIAGGTHIHLVGLDGGSTTAIIDGINRISKGIEIRYRLVHYAHLSTRRHIIFGINHLSVAFHYDLVDGCKRFPSQGDGGVFPCEGSRQRIVVGRHHVDVGGSCRCSSIDFSGHVVVDHALAIGVAMVINIEPAVAAATPAPVEVNHVFVVVTVQNVGVTSTAVHHRPIHINGIDDQLHILFMSVILTIQVGHVVGIEEIGGHRLTEPTCNGATARRTVVHIHADTGMIDQLRHGFNLLLWRVLVD